MSTQEEIEKVFSRIDADELVNLEKASFGIRVDLIADAVIAAGWRPPMREVATVEELEALPGKTVIEDGDGDPWIKAEAPLMDSWMYAGLEYSSENMFWGIRCPFRVVWEPEQ